MNSDFFRVAAISPRLNVADCEFNTNQIIDACRRLHKKGVQLAVFPEMSVTAYTCADLFHSSTLLKAAENSLLRIAEESLNTLGMIIVVGAPLKVDNGITNCAVVISNGLIRLAVPKTYVPNYNEFYEQRWWSSLEDDAIVTINGKEVIVSDKTLIDADGVKIGFEICEDLWAPIPPSTQAALNGAQIIVNLSASNDLIGKYNYLTRLIVQQSSRCIAAYVYAGAGYGESTTDLVFDGKTIIAENGKMLECNNRFSREENVAIADIDIDNLNRDRLHNTTFNQCIDRERIFFADSIKLEVNDHDNEILREIDPHPFVPAVDADLDTRCREILSIQSLGLCRRLEAAHSQRAVVGISGGLDSTLALLVAVNTFDILGRDRKDIIGVTMPGFGTTDRTYNNALTLMRTLGITLREVKIVDAVKQHFTDIGHNPEIHDVTYENSQARYRTMLLMDIANKENGMVIGTGDLSELALGWATYNGDHMSMYGVNAGVPKTLVRHLVKWYATQTENVATRDALLDILATPISPELLPSDADGKIAQLTEDLVGPYELHDFFLYRFIRFGESPRKIFRLAVKAFNGAYDEETIRKWLRTFFRRFFAQQFKRSCLPDGPKVGSVCLSPRGDWRMPSDASSEIWLKEIDSL